MFAMLAAPSPDSVMASLMPLAPSHPQPPPPASRGILLTELSIGQANVHDNMVLFLGSVIDRKVPNKDATPYTGHQHGAQERQHVYVDQPAEGAPAAGQ
jgi:hypothetical protein